MNKKKDDNSLLLSYKGQNVISWFCPPTHMLRSEKMCRRRRVHNYRDKNNNLRKE